MKIKGIATRSMIGHINNCKDNDNDSNNSINNNDNSISDYDYNRVKQEHVKIGDSAYVNKIKRNYFLINVIEKYNENM